MVGAIEEDILVDVGKEQPALMDYEGGTVQMNFEEHPVHMDAEPTSYFSVVGYLDASLIAPTDMTGNRF
jgi:hypothetical protein